MGQAHLLARPQWLWPEDSWHWHAPIPVLEPHDNVHHHVLANEGVPLGHQAAPQQCVLHDSNDRLIGLQQDLGCEQAVCDTLCHDWLQQHFCCKQGSSGVLASAAPL